MSEIMVRLDDLRRYCEKRHCGSVPLEYIKQMPTIDPEVRHGRWIDNESRCYPYKCASCNTSADWHYKFCPNCGADMREVGAYNANNQIP